MPNTISDTEAARLSLAARDIILDTILFRINSEIGFQKFWFADAKAWFNHIELSEDGTEISLYNVDNEGAYQVLSLESLCKNNPAWAALPQNYSFNKKSFTISKADLGDFFNDEAYAVAIDSAHADDLATLPEEMVNQIKRINIKKIAKTVGLIAGYKDPFGGEATLKYTSAYIELKSIKSPNAVEPISGPWLVLKTESKKDSKEIQAALLAVAEQVSAGTIHTFMHRHPVGPGQDGPGIVFIHLASLEAMFSKVAGHTDISEAFKTLNSLKDSGHINQTLLSLTTLNQALNAPANDPVAVTTANSQKKQCLFATPSVDFFNRIEKLTLEELGAFSKASANVNTLRLMRNENNESAEPASKIALEVERLPNSRQKITYHELSDDVFKLTVDRLKPEEIKATKFKIKGASWEARFKVAVAYAKQPNMVFEVLAEDNKTLLGARQINDLATKLQNASVPMAN